MSQKAYKSGSSYPELKQDTLRLYSSRICPFSERVRLVLAHKNIPHEVVNIDLKDKPEWFLEKTLGKTPVLQLSEDMYIYDSGVICEYLDEVYRGQGSLQAEGYHKAKDRNLMDNFGQITSPYHFIAFPQRTEDSNDDATLANKIEQIQKGFQIFNDELAKRDSQFFGGNVPGMVDFLMWPHMERIPALTTLESRVEFSKSRYLHLYFWWWMMKDVPAVAREMEDTRWHLEMFKRVNEGMPHADYGLGE